MEKDSTISLEEVEELPSSKLGTKKHWDKTYDKELKEFERRGDVGEIWFGEESEDRVIDWLTEEYQNNEGGHQDTGDPSPDEGSGCEGHLNNKCCSVLDLGTGNGHFLLRLGSQGFTELYGIDYSETSVKLAKKVAEDKGHNITFATVNLVSSSLPEHPLTQRTYRVCHDKGTYDAVSLTPDTSKRDREQYIQNVCRLLEPDGVLIITSCNWTEDELLQHFHGSLTKVHTIPTPRFMFGGKTGSLVTSIVLKKVNSE